MNSMFPKMCAAVLIEQVINNEQMLDICYQYEEPDLITLCVCFTSLCNRVMDFMKTVCDSLVEG